MKIVSPRLQKLFALWDSRRHSPFPRRSEFQPSDLRFILGGISLIDIHREPLRFFYRLHGTSTAQWLGFDLTRKFLDQAPSKSWAERTGSHLTQVALSGIPSVVWHTDERIADHFWNLEALVLPLSREGTGLNMLISAVEQYAPDTKHAIPMTVVTSAGFPDGVIAKHQPASS